MTALAVRATGRYRTPGWLRRTLRRLTRNTYMGVML